MTAFRFFSFLILVATAMAAPVAPESTPTGFPGAKTFIYRENAIAPMRLFVVKPDGWKATDHRSALMFFFGGGWTTGTPQNSIDWAKFAAKLGMVGIAPDYRTKGRTDTSPLESVADSRAAFHWVQEHAAELGIAPSRIVVGGNSAGGHVALWTAITKTPPGSAEEGSPRSKPAALILFSTVSDTSTLTGYTPKRFGEHATDLSPVHQLDAKMPPVLAFHGDADKTVPLQQALALRDKLIATGNSCELHIVPGGGHNFSKDLPEWKNKSRQLMVEFLKQQLLVPRDVQIKE
jgi:acetyl esterase